MLRREHFEALPEHATFINTGREATVVEEDLVAVLRARPDLAALLDVSSHSPALEALPNCALSSHIAGSQNAECRRMADFVIEEFERYRKGEALRYAVALEMLPTMA